ncbi:V-type sodium ATPase subunit C [Clostridium saccharobutylicum]|uniref:V-type ATP synthase subunit C n=1 Tax=Clostridium saccharobutylicum TaxID=169679 RepID=UPI000983FC3A|nr:V-type ATP synthase subunit C [Clostridium saccharobutylicum]AQS10852.1 V-type sodium ATPase subunit C [Clostridium saccharobutylicum]MBC2436427.1 V-type ATP synthase subunit C [Clostridium saccharobutylicum]NSB88097.1 V/A-type H+-transporting ATPase subunit C [Clostridium saccharobutylicum]NYC31828.1 V/A-type H+-transporting ATPase subunit C [Clostridium saccharobutylicum]OOM19109.1 V-type sodium ATPase subunit C [Clostridium saccharobutylicum]
MDKMQFSQVIPRIRVYETKLLNKAQIDRMIDSNSAYESLKILKETEYVNVMTDINKAEDYELMLSRELIRVFDLMYYISPVKGIIDLMSIKYDYHNIKVILKGIFLKKDLSYLLINVGTIDALKLRDLIKSDNIRELPIIMRDAIEEVNNNFQNTKDPQLVDIILDRYMFKSLMQIKSEIKDIFVDKYITTLIDSTNLKTLLRIKKQNKDKEFLARVIIEGGSIDKNKFLEIINDDPENIYTKFAHTSYAGFIKVGIDDYIKNKSVSLLEKLIDNYIMSMMRDAKIIPFGVEPLLAYIYAKETEIKIIRIIMVGKLNNIGAGLIRERLRDIYV